MTTLYIIAGCIAWAGLVLLFTGRGKKGKKEKRKPQAVRSTADVIYEKKEKKKEEAPEKKEKEETKKEKSRGLMDDIQSIFDEAANDGGGEDEKNKNDEF